MRKAVNRIRAAVEMAALLAVDLASLYAAFRAAVFLRVSVLPRIYSGFPAYLTFKDMADIWWVLLPWAFFLYYEGLYTKRLLFWDEVGALCKAAIFSTVGVFTIVSVGKLSADISRTVVALMGAIALVSMPVLRMSAKAGLRKAGLLKRRVLILGAGKTGRLMARALRGEPNYGFTVIGFLDDDPSRVGAHIDGIKVHRGVDSADRYIEKCGITDIIIAMPGAAGERLQGLVSRLQHRVERVLLIPGIFGMAATGTSLHYFFDAQAFALSFKNNLARPLPYATKRTFDFLCALALSALLFLPILVIAAVIKAASGGPVIYRQERMGKHGKPFPCLKFRTMYEDSEGRLREILDGDPGARGEWEKFKKLRKDPRVTPVGAFLRRTSLDELPQIMNILGGEMSLVGPRPYLPGEKGSMGEYADTVLCVPPGITGLWQVSGRSNLSFGERLALDSWYVRNWNLWLDIVILLRTVGAILRQEGAS